MSAPASTYTATPTGLTAFAPWDPNALLKAGVFLILAGAFLQALQSTR